jgi:hypothetical protein
MKKRILLFTLFTLVCLLANAQYGRLTKQRILTDPLSGVKVEQSAASSSMVNRQQDALQGVATPGTNWHATDAAAIGNYAKVSAQGQKTAAGWTLNNQRLSLYGTSNVPIWEVPLTIQTDTAMPLKFISPPHPPQAGQLRSRSRSRQSGSLMTG